MSKTCAIICGGPSLAKEDLSLIDVDKIGINLSFVAVQSEYQVFTAKDLFDSHGETLHRLTPEAIRFGTYYAKGCFRPDWKGWFELPDDYSIYAESHGWMVYGGAPCALQVAISFGYNEVIFCGLDLYADSTIHFYPKEFDSMVDVGHVDLNWRNTSYLKQIEFFLRLQSTLNKRGIKVYNTSMKAYEHLYEKVPFKDFWG